MEVVLVEQAHELVVHRTAQDIGQHDELRMLVVMLGDDLLQLVLVIDAQIDICCNALNRNSVAKDHLERRGDALREHCMRGDYDSLLHRFAPPK